MYDNMTMDELFYIGKRFLDQRSKLLLSKDKSKQKLEYANLLREDYEVIENLIYSRILGFEI